MRWLLTTALVALGGYAMAAEVVTIDSFEYPDAAAARAVWEPMFPAGAAETMPHDSAGGKTALKIPCKFTDPTVERGSLDRKGPLDLLRAGAISFDFYVDDPAPISYCSIYFHSGGGWYSTQFGVSKGWQRIVLGKGSFGVEDQPGGWDQVDTIRVSAWKGKAVDTFCALDNLEARTEDIAVVRGMAPAGEDETARRCAEQVGGYLDKLGIPYGVITDRDVAGGALSNQKIAIFTYSPAMTPEAISQTLAYIQAGGKAMMFYSLPDELHEPLGVARLTYLRQEREGHLARLALDAPGLVGLPAAMQQNSWNVNLIQPGGHNARVIGAWQDDKGQAIGPGVVLSDNGLYMGHILTDADPENKQAFVMAALGHFLPTAWQTAAQAALSLSLRIGPYRTRDELNGYLQPLTAGTPYADQLKGFLAKAQQAEAQAAQLLNDQRYPEVLVAARQVREAYGDAYLVAHSPRAAEFRAVWNHSGTGDCGTWDEGMKRLQAGNFNAVVPNMWWGGLAHYDSKLLPLSGTFRDKGDQISQCVAAGRKYGIEVHPWKVNWNLTTAPKEFVDQMRAEGRLLVNSKGETEPWLCASNALNLQLEIDTMLEVALNYDVDGVHFDYIRYPHDDGCFCDGCRRRFEARLGKQVTDWPADCRKALREEWMQFRCDNITLLVKLVAVQARKAKPWLRISAAVFSDYPGCKYGVGQDWVKWCREGDLDFVCPMNYSESNTRFQNLVTTQVSLVGGYVPMYSGIGQFIIPDDQVVAQMAMARDLGADGFIVFNMGTGLAEQGLPRYALGMTSAPAILPHNAPEIRFRTSYDAAEEPIQVQEAELRVTVEVRSLGRHRQEARGLSGAIELQDASGKALKQLGALPAVGGKVELTLPKQSATTRVVAVGTLTYQDGAKSQFVVRSRPYAFAAK